MHNGTKDEEQVEEHCPHLREAFDWGARRNYLVFLGLAVGHGFVAGALDPLALTLPLYVFRIANPEIVQFVTIFAMVALIMGWWILLNRFCRSLQLPEALSSSPEAVAYLRPWRRSLIGWLLIVMWVFLGMPVAHVVELVGQSLIHGTFDSWNIHGPISMVPVLIIGLSTLPGFMDRWGQKKVARNV